MSVNHTASVSPGTTQASGQPSIGTLVAEASSSFSTLLHGEIELAKLEIKASVKNAGTGAGMFGATAVLMVFALIFGLIALAEGLVALHLWRWVAYLIVFGLLLLLAGLFALLGLRKVKRVKAPQQTIDTTKSTVTALRQATSHQASHRA
ncbi:phage holin family protein [Jatrophihabitans sp.]|uniref:phage holin family protein n=1 Tax=Jatrophihabitans sp. TaxID=1932789 RepID=UPI002CFA34C2|nr:phage holin family protein [Jatrophihabitans sp.]